MNNITCEELVGLFSAIQQRAPNGTMLFYSAKIKAKKNKTDKYLRGLDGPSMDAIIKKSISLAVSTRMQSHSYVQEMHADLIKRVNEKIR